MLGHIPVLLTLEQVLSEGIVHNLTIMITWQMCYKFISFGANGVSNFFRMLKQLL